MSVTRSGLVRGPAQVTWNGITMFSKEDIAPRHAPSWDPVLTSMYGEVDKVKKDLVIKIPLRLWGAWESISVLFPTAVLNPVVGSAVFPASDLPLVITARNGDQVTYANAQLTKLADLRLGVDADVFSADVEFTAILKNSANPEDDGAYYTTLTGATFTESAFAKTNFKRVRFTGAWGTKAGFTAIIPQDGFRLGWNLSLKPVTVDGLGTVDFTHNGLVASCKCIPIQPTMVQVEAQAKLGGNGTGNGTAHGTLLGGNVADLTLTGTGVTVVLKNAAIEDSGYVWSNEKLRQGEISFATTRGFTTGVPNAVATVA